MKPVRIYTPAALPYVRYDTNAHTEINIYEKDDYRRQKKCIKIKSGINKGNNTGVSSVSGR